MHKIGITSKDLTNYNLLFYLIFYCKTHLKPITNETILYPNVAIPCGFCYNRFQYIL